MFITYDPNLADVLAGRTEATPWNGQDLLLTALLAAQLLSLLAIGLLVA